MIQPALSIVSAGNQLSPFVYCVLFIVILLFGLAAFVDLIDLLIGDSQEK